MRDGPFEGTLLDCSIMKKLGKGGNSRGGFLRYKVYLVFGERCVSWEIQLTKKDGDVSVQLCQGKEGKKVFYNVSL